MTDPNPYQSPSSDEPEAKKSEEGWVLDNLTMAFAIGLVIFMAANLYGVYNEGQALLTQRFADLLAFDVWRAMYVIAVYVIGVLITLASIYMVYLTYNRRRRIVNFYPIFYAIMLFFLLVTHVISASMFDAAVFDSAFLKSYLVSIFLG